MTELSDNPEYDWSDLKPILDFEIDALPEKYRLPLILHYMQGQTKEETARLLGLKSGTVSTWLDRGRDMLRERLARRGLTVTGVVLVGLLMSNSTIAALSPAAAEATVQAAVQIAAGELTAGAVSAQVAALTQGTLKALAVAKLKLIAASVAAVLAVSTVVGVAAYQVLRAPTPLEGNPSIVSVAALDRLDPEAIPAAEEFDWQPTGLVAVAGEHLGRHTGVVNAVAFHTDGRLAISAGPNGQIRIWDAQARRLRHTLSAGSAILSLALSKDGSRLACGLNSGSVIVWALEPGAQPSRLLSFTASSTPAHAVAFSPVDSKRLVVGTGEGSVQLWNVAGKEGINLAMVSEHEGAIRSVAYAPDGKTLASSSDDMTVQIWDVTAPEPVAKARLQGHTGPVLSVAIARSGLVASGSDDGTVRLWQPNGSAIKSQHVFQPQVGKVHAVTFHPDGTTLAVAGSDRRICLWQVGRFAKDPPRLGVNLEGHRGPVFALAFGGPDGKQLVSGSADWTARFWQFQDFQPFERTGTMGHLSHVYAAAFAPDGKHMATSSRDGTIRVWGMDGPAPQELHVLKDNPDVTALAFAADGESFTAVSLSGQGLIKQFGVADGKEQRQVSPQLKGMGLSVAISSGGRQVLLGCRDKTLRLWDISNGQEAARLSGHESPVHAVAFSADGRRALSGSGQMGARDGKSIPLDCTVRLWDLEAKKQLGIAGSHGTPVTQGVLFSSDGKRAFSGSSDRLIKQWDISHASPQELDLTKEQREGFPLGMTGDGRYFVTSKSPGSLTVWQTAANKKSHEWTFPEPVSCISFAADSRHLAIGLSTGVVYIVRLESRP